MPPAEPRVSPPENQALVHADPFTHDRGDNVTALLQEEPRGERQPRRLLIVRSGHHVGGDAGYRSARKAGVGSLLRSALSRARVQAGEMLVAFRLRLLPTGNAVVESPARLGVRLLARLRPLLQSGEVRQQADLELSSGLPLG